MSEKKTAKPSVGGKKQGPRSAPKRSAKTAVKPRGPTIVGIAGSAGALTAMQRFFDGLPAKTGVAFVVITHLHPEHESHLAELLQRHTKMTVTQVTRKQKLKPDSVYVIPPNSNIQISDSTVEPAEFEQPRAQHNAIDFFLRSLADAQPDAVAVILSGGGSDGAVGVRAIKEAGGFVMVQDPQGAEYNSMPAAAVATGVPDVVLPVEELPGKLMEIIRHAPALPADPDGLSTQDWETIAGILIQMRKRTGHDFSHYKQSTVLRRIRRRMQVTGRKTLEDYLGTVRADASEGFYLLNDLLIGVTNFFRDPAAWDALSRTVIPQIFEHKRPGESIRGWSIGCATGEEAYSLAMLLQEHASTLKAQYRMAVFASDLDEEALVRAREGIYPAAIEADVSPARLERFFTKVNDHYQVRRELREMMLFTNHSVLRDPPFSKQDVVCCRNLLIYMERGIQSEVLDLIHYALNPDGYLLLGSAESADSAEGLFATIDKSHKIFQALPWRAERPHVPSLPLSVQGIERRAFSAPGAPRFVVRPRPPYDGHMLEEQHQLSLESFAPPSILVSGDYTVQHLSESAGRYLRQPRGPLTSDLLKLVRPELHTELSAALFQSFSKDKAIVGTPVNISLDGQRRLVTIAVRPIRRAADSSETRARQALVVFLEDETEAPPAAPESEHGASSHDLERSQGRVVQLEAEVRRLRDALQAASEQYDSSTEEMRAANEELQSINEEYHLTTEELETSKEELEAVNEELQTVNNELKGKLEEISRAHKDLESVMGAMEIAMLFLDRELRIQRYTPALGQFFNILKTDIGRPIGHLSHKLGSYDKLTLDARDVLDNLTILDREVEGDEGQWYLIRLRPYRTTEGHIEGVVITFVDVSEIKEADIALRQMNETLEARVEERTRALEETGRRIEQTSSMFSTLFHANPIPTSLTRMEDGTFLDVNESYVHFFGLPREKVVGRRSQELGLPFEAGQRKELVKRLQREGSARNWEMALTRPPGERRTVLASMQRVTVDGEDAILATFIDITDRVRAERQVRLLAANLTVAEQRERYRISQMLHDDLQQRLFSVKMQLSFLQQAVQEGRMEAITAEREAMESSLAEAIETTRRLSIDLSPAILRGASLADALAWLKEDVQQRYGLDVRMEVKGEMPDVPEHMRVLLFNTLRELLFNVVKHSEVLLASMVVEPAEGGLRITLTDHGKGFDVQGVMADPKAAHGLLEQRNRLSLLGCSMEVESHPGDGTTIVIGVPA